MKRISLLSTVALAAGILWLAASPATAADPECTALGGSINGSGECQVSAGVTRSNAGHGGPFNLAETLRITSNGRITVAPPASAAALTLNISGQLIMEAGSKIAGDVTTTGGVGATITVNASGTIDLAGSTQALPGAVITATQIAGSCTTGGHGGRITLNSSSGNIVTNEGSLISVNATCPAGDIFITASAGRVDIDGSVLAQSTLSGTGGSEPGGGTITIISCDLEVSDTGVISSRGQDPGADLVHLEACFVTIHGLVESVSTNAGHTQALNLCNNDPARHPLGLATGEFAGCVEVWSGTFIVVDQSGGNNGEVSADGVRSPNRSWIDLLANGDITLTGGAGYAVHANGANGGPTSNSFGGLITVESFGSNVLTSGLAIQANAVGAGSDGGDVRVLADKDVLFGTASIQAEGPNGDHTAGGHITGQAFTGLISGAAPGELNASGGGGAGGTLGTVSLTACTADPALTYLGTSTPAATNNFPICAAPGAPPVPLPSNCSNATCTGELPPPCEKAAVQSVLDPLTGRFPGNKGPDVIVNLAAGDKVQDAVNTATDSNADGYIIILVHKDNSGQLGGNATENVDVNRAYAKRFALIGCSVTLHALDANLPAGHVAATASSPVGSAENIFVMDLHGSDSHVAGWKVEGNGRYFRNVATSNSGFGIWFLGNGNTMHNGNGNSNVGTGIVVQGNGNTVDSSDAFGNGGNGVTVAGATNKVLKVDAGDKGKGNGGDGVSVSGNGNTIQEVDAFSNSHNGIAVAGDSNKILKNNVGDRNKGNLLDGILLVGKTNTVQENDAYANGRNGFNASGGPNSYIKNTGGDRGDKANGLAGFVLVGGGSMQENTAIGNLGDGFKLMTSSFSLLKNTSGGTGSGQPNAGCQYMLNVAGNANSGSNKSNNVLVSGNPLTAGCK